MSNIILSIERTKKVYRVAVGTLFFLLGISSATWASRIPTIQQTLRISDSLLGVVLFALPVGSMLSLVFSGALVSTYGSRKVAANALLLYGLLLPAIALSTNLFVLLPVLVLFGAAGNTANIAINTQAVHVETKYGRSIMASFHGLWSLAGFSAAGIGAFMMANGVMPLKHFVTIASFVAAGIAICFKYLVSEEEAAPTQKRFFTRPDKALMRLGVVAFCCMICEGAMFDWSGIYFHKVVQADKSWIGAGYTAFMCTMATGRFLADWVANHWSFRKTIMLSGLLIATGLGIAVAAPFVITSIIGFLIVGFGVSSVVPLVYSQAGKSKTASPGAALTAVSSIGFLGFLVGPPLIGAVAGLLSLRVAFLLIALIGIAVVFIAGRSNRQQQ